MLKQNANQANKIFIEHINTQHSNKNIILTIVVKVKTIKLDNNELYSKSNHSINLNHSNYDFDP